MFLEFLRDERFEASANSASLHVALNTNAKRHDYLNLRYNAPEETDQALQNGLLEILEFCC